MLSKEKRVDPRVRRTRRLLEQALLDLLVENDFQSICVQEITTRAGINRATFYAHFTDKYDLLDTSIRESFRDEIHGRLLHSCEFGLENVCLLIQAVCEYLDRLAARCAPSQRQFDPLVETQVKAQLHELILAWLVQAAPASPDLASPPEIAATAASWAIYGLAFQWKRSPQTRPSAEAYAGQVLPLVAANLGLGTAR